MKAPARCGLVGSLWLFIILACGESCRGYAFQAHGSRDDFFRSLLRQPRRAFPLRATTDSINIATNTTQPPSDTPSPSEIPALKASLLSALQNLQQLQQQDGDISIDFGVKGGELNATSRAPQRVNYYSISPAVGQAADVVMNLCQELSKVNPTPQPTAYLGDKKNGLQAPLHGRWKLLFSTAADAIFSKNSTRGSAKAQNIVSAPRGRITNVIDFDPLENGKEPPLKQLQVVIAAKAKSPTRVELQFRYAKAVLTKFFFLPLFGRRLTLYIPVPAAFITRVAILVRRFFGFGKVKEVPKAYFDVLYLDDELRIHKTAQDNLFVQGKATWAKAQPLMR